MRHYGRQLHLYILGSIVLGGAAGALLGPAGFGLLRLELVGELFIRALRMLVVPLIITSVIAGVANVGGGGRFGKLFGRTLLYYLVTTTLAVALGLLLVNLVRPGAGFNVAGLLAAPETLQTVTLTEMLKRLISVNPIGDAAQGNILPLIVFCLLFGVALAVAHEKTEGARSFFGGAFEAMMTVTRWVVLTTPLGAFALTAGLTAQFSPSELLPILSYMLTVLAGLLIHGGVTLPLLLLLFGRVAPHRWFSAVSGAVFTAFATSSSSATLPLTMRAVEDKGGVSNRVSGLLLPLGATINMDGTALYESIAAIFIAQALGIDLGFGQMLIIYLTATMASVGAAGIPGAGMVMMSVVLLAVGLPVEGIGLVIAVDRMLDMVRTAVNVWGDSVGAAVVARWEGERPLSA